MANVLVLFESRYGQSAKIAEFIAEGARRRGFSARVAPIKTSNEDDLDWQDAVVVVAPTYFGRFPAVVEAFLVEQGHLLAVLPTMFVGVSNSAASHDPAIRLEAERSARTFTARVGLHARSLATVGGALAYPRYGFFLRLMMRFIAAREGSSTDTSRVHELTDWRVLAVQLGTFLQSLAPRTARATAHEARRAS